MSPEDLDRALRLQKESGERIGTMLVRLGMISERDLAGALAEQLDLELAAPEGYGDVPAIDGQVTPEFLTHAQVVPLTANGDAVLVAMADPLDAFTVDALKLALGREITVKVGAASDIEAAIKRQYGDGSDTLTEIAESYRSGDEDADAEDIQHLRDLASEAPIIRMVNLIISRALEVKASDVHIEPFGARLKTRYRVDGILREVEAPPVRSAAALISRIKVMANLNIAERRRPQDGRIKLRIEGREIDMRISAVPTLHGESVVMRILDKETLKLDFQTLGFDASLREAVDELLSRPQGIVLVTGPTGSGKTTTLYAALKLLNTPDKKILTVEDPVEYELEGINQIQVKPEIGLTFANALRSILRQDPDVIMVGEMRDLETAKIAVQSALTGHKVFSTLHTNDAASSVTRLLDMGVDDYLVTSTVNGVVAQRLVRTLCEECKQSYEVLPEIAEEFNLQRYSDDLAPRLFKSAGCDSCDGSGFRGRTTIVELIVMNDTIRRAILSKGDASEVRRAARDTGTESMRAHGIRKALLGVTTLEEVERVTREA
ncbi:MAG: type II secretion system ATPase GspE [Gammaproteobacteria bacterium]|nr:type II secretion system ATPase GspE [Gammaproteobacteria bacterium]